MTHISMLLYLTFPLLTAAAEIFIHKCPQKHKCIAQKINRRESLNLAFRLVICLSLLLFCAQILSKDAFFVPIIEAVIGCLLLKKGIANRFFNTIRISFKTVSLLFVSSACLSPFYAEEALCLMFEFLFLSTASDFYLDDETYNKRFNK